MPTSELEVLERRELQLAHQLHAVHAHERVHHDQCHRGAVKNVNTALAMTTDVLECFP